MKANRPVVPSQEMLMFLRCLCLSYLSNGQCCFFFDPCNVFVLSARVISVMSVGFQDRLKNLPSRRGGERGGGGRGEGGGDGR